MLPGVPKSLTDLAARAVKALERIADGFDEQDAIAADPTIVSASYPQEPDAVGKRILASYAKVTGQHAKAMVAILDDDQNGFEKAKRLRMLADAMDEFATDTNAQFGEQKDEASV